MTENERALLMALAGSMHVVLRHMIARHGPDPELLQAEGYLAAAVSQFLRSTRFPGREPVQ